MNIIFAKIWIQKIKKCNKKSWKIVRNLTIWSTKSPFQLELDALHWVPVERDRPRFWFEGLGNKNVIIQKGIFLEFKKLGQTTYLAIFFPLFMLTEVRLTCRRRRELKVSGGWSHLCSCTLMMLECDNEK